MSHSFLSGRRIKNKESQPMNTSLFSVFQGIKQYPRLFMALWAVLVMAELLSFNFRLVALGEDFESAATVALADSILSYLKWGGIAVAVSYITKKTVNAMVTQMSAFWALLKTMSIWMVMICFLLLSIALVASLFVPNELNEGFQLSKPLSTALAVVAALLLYGSLPYAAVMYHQYVFNAVLIREQKRTRGPRPNSDSGFVNGFKVPWVSFRDVFRAPSHFIVVGVMLACTGASSYLIVTGSPWVGAVLDSAQGVLFVLLMTSMLRQSRNAARVLSHE